MQREGWDYKIEKAGKIPGFFHVVYFGMMSGMEKSEIIEIIKQADMVLLGLGKEFDGGTRLWQNEEYKEGLEILEREGLPWLIPGWNDFCVRTAGGSDAGRAMEKLVLLLEEKNYFAVSVSVSAVVAGASWKKDRLVMPCGSTIKKQCANGCQGVLPERTGEDGEKLEELFEKLRKGSIPPWGKEFLGICPKCGAPLVFNNVYASKYNEEGYLDKWGVYMKWLQGTLNRRLAVLELGVGMDFPSVIRWPFEKAAFFNNKARFFRVNETLYQLTEELAGKGCGISQNSIDWLDQL